MAPAIFDTVAVDMLAGQDGKERTVLRANGSTLVKPGYISVYQEGMDDVVQDDSDHVLPPMQEGDRVKLTGVVPSQHFTEPPPRFSEASLVKALEEYGIGRPSTYASIISTLRDRQYVDIESRRFTATDIGKIVSRFLTQYFTTYVDYDFTAKMEDSLDAVANGEQEWVPLLEKFWKPFIDLVNHTETSVSREEVAQARDLGADPVSGKPMSVRMGRFGPFVQIGTKDDADKPRFAGLRPGQKMDAITHAQAIELFKLPRKLGTTATGDEITTNVGRFGPYVKYGAKYVSLKIDDPYEITPERALEVIREKEIADANRLILDFPDAGIQVLNGRYGPYITDKERNAKIPKDKEPKSLTLEECQTLLAAAPVRTFGKWGRGRKGANGKGAAKGPVGKAKANAAAANGAAAQPPVTGPKKRAAKGRAPTAVTELPEALAAAVQAGAASRAAPARLAAKGAKAPANKKAPAAASGAAPPKAKKSSAKKKS
jgi:DNA topoisomerase-1